MLTVENESLLVLLFPFKWIDDYITLIVISLMTMIVYIALIFVIKRFVIYPFEMVVGIECLC